MSPVVDVVIVHYTSARHLTRCVAAVRQELAERAAVWVIDNDAPEGIPGNVCASAGVTVVRAGANLGFARGANLGARGGGCGYLLVLNPDVRLSGAAFATMQGVLERSPEVAACAPALAGPEGRPQVGPAGFLPTVSSVLHQAFPLAALAGHRAPRSLFVPSGVRCGTDAFVRVDWLSAACMLIRRRAFEAVGGFDERFFLYGEDIDLGRRLGERGWQLAYLPQVSVEHLHLDVDRERVQRADDDAWLDGLDLYYRLWEPRARRLLHAIGASGFAARAILPTWASRRSRAHRRRMLAFMQRSAHHAVARRAPRPRAPS